MSAVEACSLNVDELTVGAEYDVEWDDNSSTEGGFRAVLLEKGNGVTLWSNGVLIRGNAGSDSPDGPTPFTYSHPDPTDAQRPGAWLLQRLRA